MMVPIVTELFGVSPLFTGPAFLAKQIVMSGIVKYIQFKHQFDNVVGQCEHRIMSVLRLVTVQDEVLFSIWKS